MKRLILCLATAVLAGAFLSSAAPASAAGGCATHAEYDNLEWGLSTDQVQNRFETNGWFINTTGNFFKRGYDACWTNERKVVIWYSLSLGVSDHWDIRDR
jgi:hypothetical protein